MSAKFIVLVVLAGVANAGVYYRCQFRVEITVTCLVINAQCVDEIDSVNNRCNNYYVLYIYNTVQNSFGY